MAFLMRDEHMGTRAVSSLPLGAYPWAMNSVGQVVYVDCTTDKMAMRAPVPASLTPYSPALSIERRRRCQSELGDLALNQVSFTAPAVLKVSLGVIGYIQQCLRQDKLAPLIKTEVAACTGKYMYSASGFGRLGQPSDKPGDEDTLYRTCLSTLSQGALPSVLAIHDFMGRIVFAKLKGSEGQLALFNSVGAQVRPALLFGDPSTDKAEKIEQLRGRTARIGAPGPTKAKGLLPPSEGDNYQERERGSDRWMPTESNMPNSTIDIMQRNLVFGAGPSGSTGTLLQAAKLFGSLDDEGFKQYVLAVVGYLVGGGMHSYHEVMTIARLAGCPYEDGKYLAALPASFLRSTACETWCHAYWDIVMLGGKLWSLNAPAAPVGKLAPARVEEFGRLFKPRV
jgi:hypothetical protein